MTPSDQTPSDHDSPAFALTPRMVRIAELLCNGLTNEAIALELNISSDTAKFHVFELCKRIGARNRTHAAAILATTRIAFPHAWARWLARPPAASTGNSGGLPRRTAAA